jgi:hypothetical protein
VKLVKLDILNAGFSTCFYVLRLPEVRVTFEVLVTWLDLIDSFSRRHSQSCLNLPLALNLCWHHARGAEQESLSFAASSFIHR